jgi:hypothetical protein
VLCATILFVMFSMCGQAQSWWAETGGIVYKLVKKSDGEYTLTKRQRGGPECESKLTRYVVKRDNANGDHRGSIQEEYCTEKMVYGNCKSCPTIVLVWYKESNCIYSCSNLDLMFDNRGVIKTITLWQSK